MRNFLSLAGFLALVVGGGAVIGVLTGPAAWYAGLVKPPFNPPNWVFAPVWTVLYVLVAIAGWRLWRRQPRGSAMRLWWAQLALNFAWSPVFFSAHRIDIALAIIVLLFAAIVLFIVRSRKQDFVTAVLFVPYALWVAFASLLNASLLVLNAA
jgi:tryptophan-rich sensory protein